MSVKIAALQNKKNIALKNEKNPGEKIEYNIF